MRKRSWWFGLGCLLVIACGGADGDLVGDDDFGDATSSSSGDGGGGSTTSSSGGSSGGRSSSGGSSGQPSSSSGGPGSNGSDKPNCKYDAHATGLTQHQQAGGLSFQTYAAARYDAEQGHRVVMLMHGQDSDGTGEFQALWQAIADSEDLVVIIPKGSRPATDPGQYPNGANWTVNDLNSLQDLLSEIDDCYNVDPKRHLLWGFSAGTFYGYLLGIGAAAQFSGLAMGGANASFARQNGYPPSAAPWRIPVSHVHGTQDFNSIDITRQDKADFEAAGHVFTLHEHAGGHTITAEQVRQQYDDLKDSQSP